MGEDQKPVLADVASALLVAVLLSNAVSVVVTEAELLVVDVASAMLGAVLFFDVMPLALLQVVLLIVVCSVSLT